MAASSSPGCVAHTARPRADAGTRTLVGPAGSLGAELGAFAWWMEPSTGEVAGLELAPASGASPRLDLVPLWVRAWYQLPFTDRYAHAWMWRHRAWEVRPPDPELGNMRPRTEGIQRSPTDRPGKQMA
jgi:hypothetical protein